MVTAILRLPAVMNRTGLSRSTIYLRISNGDFPRSIPLGGRSIGWIESEVNNWLNCRIEERKEHGPVSGEDRS